MQSAIASSSCASFNRAHSPPNGSSPHTLQEEQTYDGLLGEVIRHVGNSANEAEVVQRALALRESGFHNLVGVRTNSAGKIEFSLSHRGQTATVSLLRSTLIRS